MSMQRTKYPNAKKIHIIINLQLTHHSARHKFPIPSWISTYTIIINYIIYRYATDWTLGRQSRVVPEAFRQHLHRPLSFFIIIDVVFIGVGDSNM